MISRLAHLLSIEPAKLFEGLQFEQLRLIAIARREYLACYYTNKCPICFKGFKTRQRLKTHIHSNRRCRLALEQIAMEALKIYSIFRAETNHSSKATIIMRDQDEKCKEIICQNKRFNNKTDAMLYFLRARRLI